MWRLTDEDLKAIGFGGAEPGMSLGHMVADKAGEKALKAAGEYLEGNCHHGSVRFERWKCSWCIDELRAALPQGTLPPEGK